MLDTVDFLIVLVTLACKNNHIVLLCNIQCVTYRLAAVFNNNVLRFSLRTPSSTMLMMRVGSSVRGLSDVTTQKSASFAAVAPIIGRLALSLSPPQPNTAMTRPLAKP